MPENSDFLDCLEIIPVPEDNELQVVLNDQKKGIFLCPSCGYREDRNLSKAFNVQAARQVKCTCKCGHVFRVLVERRKNIRKSVNFVGMCHYSDNSGQTKKCLIKVHDVSFSGLQFSVNRLPEFRVGTQIIVDFRLDDIEWSEIKEKGTVKRIKSNKVGLQFASEARCKSFKSYLMK